ncbi:MAG: TonB-dependent receptor [Gammaproteobacteria bacterium]|nr:TonB-dependent receptor [Gammaproteobacteria bacterium]MDH4255634.1 TonB-dependent receptor [Gammaproteobacteria bacterium]MDH5311168.1 TonB-dependent receptor [Gammaproteobacteria bacterium]
MRKPQSFIATAFSSGLVLLASGAFVLPAAAQSESESTLEEIIVTAQKRTQTLAEVPLSITVLSGDMLERQQADSFRDLVALVPGFSISSSTRGVTRITLRGINTGGVATTVGVYVDDVPFGSSSGLANAAILSGDFDTFDLARVEVLRGPQGTLYGASSMGGVMKYVANRPNTEALEARGQASVETVDGGDTGYAFTGLVNVPVTDSFALRAAGFYRADAGFIDSIGNNPIASMTDPGITVVEGTRVDQGINAADIFGGRVSALFDLSDNASLNLMALMQNIESGSSDVVDADPVTLQPLNSRAVKSQYHGDAADISYRLYSATLDWDFGRVALQSVTAYSTFEHDFRTDLAANTALTGGIPLAALTTAFFGDDTTRPLSVVQDQITSTDKLTQEFRLVSEENDSFDWMVGLYYTDEESGISPQDILAVEAGTETPAEGIPLLASASLVSNYEEIALFANATWHLTDRFELSFGARQSDNDQDASQSLEGPLVGGSVSFDDAASSESPFTWSFSPRYEFSDDLSVFARVATGYRPGGPNVIPTGAPPGTPGSYDSDTLTSYELGLKAGSQNGTYAFDVTAYYLDWEDVQLLAVVNGVGLNANGGTAVSKGFEFAATVRPTEGLTLSLNGAYTDAQLTQDTDPVVGGLDGDPLSYVPEWGFGIDGSYEWSLSGDSMAYVGANLGYVGERPADFSNRNADGNIREIDSYTAINLRAGVDFGRWYVELYGRNLGDELGINNIVSEGALPNGAVGLSLIQPRTFGLSIGAGF